MKKISNNILKSTLCFILILVPILTTGFTEYNSYADKISNKKAIVLVLDMISLEELNDSNTPNIDLLLESGSIALMNTRSKSSIANKSSAYLSLGMGVKTLAPINAGLAFNRESLYPISDYEFFSESISVSDLYKIYNGHSTPKGEIVNLALGDIKKAAFSITPNNQVGLLGQVARENDLVIGLLGNGDLSSPSRDSSLMAMDENGIVPVGSIGSDLLTSDPSVLGAIKLDQDKLSSELDRILPNVDILFVDYGDPARVESSANFALDSVKKDQKIKSIERADSFLAKIMQKVDRDNTLFMIVAPNPSSEMIANGNFALTPFIVSSKDTQRGLLTSDTTRRKGLVANFNFAPTLLNFFDVDTSSSFTDGSVRSISADNATEVLLENDSKFLYLRKYRYVFHWSFIILTMLSLIGLFASKFLNIKILPDKILKSLSLTTLSIPLTMMLVSVVGYKSIVIDLLFVIAGSFLIAYLLSKSFKENLKVISILSFATSLFLLIDIYFIENLMIMSPLGSDAIAGGRFYGIGNDYMGILLGSTILGIFSWYQNSKIKKTTIAIFTLCYMSLVIVALSPFFGANIGGTLSAMFVCIISIFTILDKKFSFKKMLSILAGLFIVIILVAALDIFFNPNPSHAGKALQALMSGGSSKFIEIITIKLGQVFWNLLHASWNIVLFLQIILISLLYKFKLKFLRKVETDYPLLSKGLLVTLFGGIIVFAVNDTGTIAASILFIYLFIPLGLLINNIE